MEKLFISVKKELLLLRRDKTGLLLLFFMPAFLVLIITLIQDNLLHTDIRILFLDMDKGRIGKKMEGLLERSGNIILVKEIDGTSLTIDQTNREVADGTFQFGIVIPEELTVALEKKCRAEIKAALSPEKAGKITIDQVIPKIQTFFDPTVQGGYRTAIQSIVAGISQRIELELRMQLFFQMLPDRLLSSFPPEMASYLPEKEEILSYDRLFENHESVIEIDEKSVSNMGFIRTPTAVQQNIPAWTIFGIFFIVVPLSASLIKERESGTLMKLTSMPVSHVTILLGKIFAYICVSFGQYTVILGVGKFVLPLFGTSPFAIGPQIMTFHLILLGAICSAAGYGIMLGTVLKSHEQATVFGPVSIVIAAAMGGIMVPVYAMPGYIQPFSLLSPLFWAQNAFHDIILRGGDLSSVYPEILCLFVFSAINLIIARFYILKTA